jgi:hypothetical protein
LFVNPAQDSPAAMPHAVRHIPMAIAARVQLPIQEATLVPAAPPVRQPVLCQPIDPEAGGSPGCCAAGPGEPHPAGVAVGR